MVGLGKNRRWRYGTKGTKGIKNIGPRYGRLPVRSAWTTSA
jgi:hypothetical protein